MLTQANADIAALPNLTLEERAELKALREKQQEWMFIKDPEEALRVKDQFRRVQARITELCEKGRAPTIRG